MFERRRLNELHLKYKLEPGLRDIYVEGESDAYIVRWFLKEQGNVNAVVYQISTIDIPVERLEATSHQNNNRGRVIFLGQDLAAANLLSQATCIVDSDFDVILDRRKVSENILFTDYTCMEMYFFNTWHIDKFFSLVVGRQVKNVQRILDNISSILQELFLVRLASQLLGLNFACMPMTSCCHIEEEEIIFDFDEYLKRYFNKNKGHSQATVFNKKLDECRQLLLPNKRHQMHGHDFLELLAWYIRKAYSVQHFDSASIGRVLLACLEASKLSAEGLFVNILRRVQN